MTTARHRRFADAVRSMPEVISADWVTGEIDALLYVLAREVAELQRVLVRLSTRGGAARVTTLLHLEELKPAVAAAAQPGRLGRRGSRDLAAKHVRVELAGQRGRRGQQLVRPAPVPRRSAGQRRARRRRTARAPATAGRPSRRSSRARPPSDGRPRASPPSSRPGCTSPMGHRATAQLRGREHVAAREWAQAVRCRAPPPRSPSPR